MAKFLAFRNLSYLTADHVYPTDLRYTYELTKNEFRAPKPQIQSYPAPVVVEQVSADAITVIPQLQMVKSSLICPLSVVGNNGLTETEESSG